ncbi:MAG: hypothetical protein HDR18_16890 [Lachnospiraceae bacterium]|nr:hypothetical protein [Lachnospiraceae bacterium]
MLKEVNEGKSWRFVRDGGRPQTWDNIARWMEAVFGTGCGEAMELLGK